MPNIDWKNLEEYAYTDAYTDDDNWLWGWEFLRRNKEYKSAWEEIRKKYKKDSDEYYIASELDSNENKHLEKKWGLRHYFINPDCIDIGLLCSINTNPKFIVGKKHPLHKEFPLMLGTETMAAIIPGYDSIEDDEFAVVLDINKPISSQFERLQPVLIEMQKSTNTKVVRPTTYKDLWKKYLRVLDADAAGIKRSVAAPIIFPPHPDFIDEGTPPDKSWDETLKQARAIMNKGFKNLLSQ